MVVIISGILGFAAAMGIAAWVWFHAEPGNDHPLSDAELRERVGEAYQ